MSINQKITGIVKDELNIGLITEYDNFQATFGADAEDILHIIDAVEMEFSVDFNDSDHFAVKCISDLIRIVKSKIDEPIEKTV